MTRFPWEVEQNDPHTAATAVRRTGQQAFRGSVAQDSGLPSAGFPAQPSSRYNRLLDPQRGMLRGLGQLIGSPTEAEFQRQQLSGAQAAATAGIQQRIAKGMSPQKAILDFIQSPEGIDAFNNGVDMGDLANIGTLATEPQRDYQAEANLEKTRLEVERLRNPTTDDITEFNFAKANGYEGTFPEFLLETKRAGATNITVGGEPSDTALRKSLDTKTGELWNEYQKAGNQSAGLVADMEVIDELIKMAPQGPVIGRLQEAFPGIDSAGAAFQSIVKRLAPTLRVPGSGATSDLEFDAMMQSLPALRNKPEANKLISEMIRMKGALNIGRSEVIDSFAAGEISAAEARRKIADLDRQTIMSPKLRTLLNGLKGSPASVPGIPDSFAPNDPMRDRMWQLLTPDERKLFQ
ncbi:hypothetical protein [Mesorhizobium sp. L-8-3]|uniref:hypothetical protein n=1 Tax=Mesorhizobium sp. L-8-3 TaxID=2744522 RepID=UPI00192563DC|nr:hypothetical protein [Mesorhizobium sp. L-8-3]BCH25772.1 hypothetical protein MesoLjLb_55570 [Mesorhizobium sp. L-8-3]